MRFATTTAEVLRLDISGLDDVPGAAGFSTELTNSYFAENGIDVSIRWNARDMHDKVMTQHRANQDAPQQVTIRSIMEVNLGSTPVTEVIYLKSLAIPDPENPEALTQGAEVTWQYLWPLDAGHVYGMLTIWRAGLETCDLLERGFDAQRDRWQVAPPAGGAAYDMSSRQDGAALVLEATFITVPDVPWGRIIVPVFTGYDDWAIDLSLVAAPGLTLSHDDMLELPDAAIDTPESVAVFLTGWDRTLSAISDHLNKAAQAFADAIGQTDPQVTLWQMNFRPDGKALQLIFEGQDAAGDDSEGMVVIKRDGTHATVEITH